MSLKVYSMCALLCFCTHTAMLKKPVVTEVRTPTNTWSGLGFSKSMPAETIKELRRANHVPYKPSMSTTYEVRPTRLQWLSLYVYFIDFICLAVYKRWHVFVAYIKMRCSSTNLSRLSELLVYCFGFSLSGFPAVLVSIQQPGGYR